MKTHTKNKRNTLLALLVLNTVFFFWPACAAVVTSEADSGPGSLREAIASALPGEAITFSGVDCITLTSGELFIDKDLLISGPGASNLTIQRSTDSGTPHFRIFHCSANILISGVKVSNGRADSGGGIYNVDTLTLRDCEVFGNTAALGGGIMNSSAITLENSTIQANSAFQDAWDGYGGGICNCGTISVINSFIVSNSVTSGAAGAWGGGIYNNGTLLLTQTIVANNSAIGSPKGGGGFGGGINNDGGTLYLDTSTIHGNAARGGFSAVGGVASGGGIANGFATMEIDRSTISGNTAVGGDGITGGSGEGGGLANDFGTVYISSSTVSGNFSLGGSGSAATGSPFGGGIYNNFGTVDMISSTIVSNAVPCDFVGSGAGVFNCWSALQLKNTIITANSCTLDIFVDELSSVYSCGFNVTGVSAGSGQIFLGTGDQTNVTANALNVGPLRNNGGPTFTHALLAGSVALNAGDNTDAPATDQRGFARIVNNVIDIGAYEQNNSSPVINCPTPITLDWASANGQLATLAAEVSDEDGDPLAVVWAVDGEPFQTNMVAASQTITTASVSFSAIFGLGTHQVTITVSDPEQCMASCSTTVDVYAEPSLSLTKSADKSLITANDKVTYTYAVLNTGGHTITDIVVSDDSGTESPGDDFVVGTIPALAPGASVTLASTLRVKPVEQILCETLNGTNLVVGTLYTTELASGDVQVFYVQHRVNENRYGTGATGWPSGHTFNNLVGSDKAEFRFTDGAGNVVLDFYCDYISSSTAFPSGYGCLGLGGDGTLVEGNPAHILFTTTSLNENFKQSQFRTGYFVNSPPETAEMSGISIPAGWDYDNSYTVVVSKDAFGTNGFGSVSVPCVHNSPAKLGSNAVYPTNYSECLINIATAVGTSKGTTVSATASAQVCFGAPYDPSPASSPDCNITPGIIKFDKNKLLIPLKNNGSQDIFMSAVSLSWPQAVNGKLKKVRLNGDVWTGPATNSPANLTITSFHDDRNRRKIGHGQTETLLFEFEKNASRDATLYSGAVSFGSSDTCTLTLP